MFVHFILFQVLCLRLVSLSSELAADLQYECILGLSGGGIGEHRHSSESCPCVPWQAWAVPKSLPGSMSQCWSRREFMEGDPATASSTHAQGFFCQSGKESRKAFHAVGHREKYKYVQRDMSVISTTLPTPKAQLHLSIHGTWS